VAGPKKPLAEEIAEAVVVRLERLPLKRVLK
jgi:hypothetical protein